MNNLSESALASVAIVGAASGQTSSPEDLTRRALERRAIEAVNWGIPVVNFDRMVQAIVRDAKGKMNQIVYWSTFLDSKNRTLTPNPVRATGNYGEIFERNLGGAPRENGVDQPTHDASFVTGQTLFVCGGLPSGRPASEPTPSDTPDRLSAEAG